jgi:hypothetical protein
VSSPADIDGILVQWGDRLFYPPNRIVRPVPPARLTLATRQKAATIRARIQATVRRAPQVMVKVTGGGRGIGAIAAHLRYISKNGRLPVEDDRGITREGKDVVRDVVEQWRYGGSYIPEEAFRREAFNITLSMPRGTDPLAVQRAGREFAQAELKDHRWVMVLHDHQANPHVHITVRAESRRGQRLNPRKADLHRWRETFAEKLRGWGIEAEATRQVTRGEMRNFAPIWQVKAREEGRLKRDFPGDRPRKTGLPHAFAVEAWANIIQGLVRSDVPGDRALAEAVSRYVRTTPFALEHIRRNAERTDRKPDRERTRPAPELTRALPDRDIER